MRKMALGTITAAVIGMFSLGTIRATDTRPTGDEMRMAEKVRKEIVRLTDYGVFDNIGFAVKDNRVVLTGQASRPTLKSSAERVVKRIEGIEAVDNRIEVLPLSGHDDALRARVYWQVYGDAVLSRYNPNRAPPRFWSPAARATGITHNPPIGNHAIHIIVRQGHVTLEGYVDSEADRNVAGMRANEAFGVFSVTNNLVVPENGVS